MVVLVSFRYFQVPLFIGIGCFLAEVFISVTTVVHAAEQELELYTEVDQGGIGLLIRGKVANLRDLAPNIVDNVQSFCVQGRWRIFPKLDFTYDDIADLLAFSTKTFKCHNSPIGSGSARYLGASDTESRSISFYSGENQIGSEVVVEAQEFVDIPFSPRSLMTSGTSSWTVYAEKNFNGPKICYQSVKRVTVINSIVTPMGSVKKNCTETVDVTIILDNPRSAIFDIINSAVRARADAANPQP